MFYIGSKDVDSVLKGYRGSVVSKQYGKIFDEEMEKNPELFKVRIISYHATRTEAYEREQKFQIALNVLHNPLYFNRAIAGKALGLSNKGRKFSKEHIDRMVSSRKNFWRTKGSSPTKGKKLPRWTEERRQKFKQSRLRAKLSGARSPMYGKKHSIETRAKMREAAIRRGKNKRGSPQSGRNRIDAEPLVLSDQNSYNDSL